MGKQALKPDYMKKSDLYDRVLGDFPYAERTFKKMAEIAQEIANQKGNLEVLEYGFGTGLLTIKIARLKKVSKLTGLDPSKDFFQKATQRLKSSKKVRLLCRDALLYIHPQKVDLILASFTYHHIPDSQKLAFLKSAVRNLKNNGLIIIGDEFLPPFKTKSKKIAAIKKFYRYFTDYLKRKKASKETLAAFQDSLEESLKGVEEYKTSLAVFRAQLHKLDLKIEKMIPIYPRKRSANMGCKVIVISKQV